MQCYECRYGATDEDYSLSCEAEQVAAVYFGSGEIPGPEAGAAMEAVAVAIELLFQAMAKHDQCPLFKETSGGR